MTKSSKQREITGIIGREGVFEVVRRGTENTRVCPYGVPAASFKVESSLLVGVTGQPLVEDKPSESSSPDMGDSFDQLDTLVEMVAAQHSNGIFITGPGGVGKTFTVKQVLSRLGLRPGDHYVTIKGYSTAASMYNLICKNRDKLIIFDDCDSVVKDQIGANILKAILDTYPEREVSWESNSSLIEEPSFVFTGQVIFISNLDPSKMNTSQEALLTRTLHVHISGSKEQVRDRCCELLPTIAEKDLRDGNLTLEDIAEMRAFLLENYEEIRNLSLRYVVHLISVRKFKPTTWKEIAVNLR